MKLLLTPDLVSGYSSLWHREDNAEKVHFSASYHLLQEYMPCESRFKGLEFIDLIHPDDRAKTKKLPELHITGGLSNISYGLPQSHIINKTCVALMMDAGMESAIIDPLDQKNMTSIRTADMLLGQDGFCMNYPKGVWSGQIKS